MTKKGIYKKLFLFSIFVILFSFNANSQKEIIVKQIDFKLEYVSESSYENEYFATLKLTKGIKYIFKITNHINDFAGEAIVELLDGDKLETTNVSQDKYYKQFAFVCGKTGFYDVLIKFKDNKIGHSNIDIYMVQ